MAEFVKDVYDNHKHIKLVGTQFGSHVIAYALDGEIERVPSLPENQNVFIGKEDVKPNKSFWAQDWCQTHIDGIDSEELDEM